MTHIVINDTTPRASFTVGATPSDGPFEIEFAVFDPETDLKVYDDGVELTYSAAPTLATEWGWVATNPVDGGHQGGEVILGGTVTNSVILVTRETAIERTSDFQYPSGSLNIQALNTQLDKLFAIHQDKAAALERVLRQPDSDVDLIDPLPAAADRANMFFAFDADGNPTVAAGVSESGTPVSAYMDSSFTSANEAAFKAYHNLEAGTDFVAPNGDGSGLTHIAYSHGMALSNGKLAWSVSANALTVAVKTLAGADPSAADPVKIAIPDGSGGVNVRTISAALSLTISSGSTMGATNSVAFRLWIGALDNAGTVELFAINARSANDIVAPAEFSTVTTTAEGGAGAADSAQVPYSTAARSTKYFRWVGFADWDTGLGTVGTWSAGPTEAFLVDPATPRPGEKTGLRKRVTKTDTSTVAITAGTFADMTGLSVAITPNSPCNLVHVHGHISAGVTSGAENFTLNVLRGSTIVERGDAASNRQRGMCGQNVESNAAVETLQFETYDFPGAASSTTYKLQASLANSEDIQINKSNADTDAVTHQRLMSAIAVEEIMG